MHLVQQCHHAEATTDYSGWYMSEKLDGLRAWWDGGITRGMRCNSIPWANTVRGGGDQVSTSLWTRYGNVHHAPSWWLDQLPPGVWLDGELWMGYGHREDLLRRTRGYSPTFEGVGFHIYDMIPPLTMTAARTYTCTGYKVKVPECSGYVRGLSQTLEPTPGRYFFDRYMDLENLFAKMSPSAPLALHPHTRIPDMATVLDAMERVITRGGEGLVLRANRMYICDRSRGCLKMKDIHDAEATIVGVTAGLGKYTGMIGALIVQTNATDNVASPRPGLIFHLSGMDDAIRAMLPSAIVGRTVTYRYRCLTKAGVPSEARFYRFNP